jgi:hypothetical protein
MHGNARYDAIEKAFRLDGTSGTYMSGTQNLGTGTPAHTITGWFKQSVALNNWTYVMFIGTSGTGQMSGMLISNTGQIVFDIYNTRIDTTVNASTGIWHHFAGVFKGGTSVWDNASTDLYINGQLEASAAPDSGTQYPFSLTGNGIQFGSSTNFNRYFNGSISQFKLYNTALTAGDVKTLYDMGRGDSYHVTNFQNTLVGINLGNGRAPRGALDVRGVVSIDNIIPHGYLQLNQGSRPGASTATHGMRWTNTDNSNHWHLFNSNNDHFRFVYNGVAKGYVDPNDANAQMNFTGQHRTFIKNVPFSQVGELEGLIVSSDQNKYIKMSGGIEVGSNAITTNESLPVVSLSNVVTDKRCFGVISASEDPEQRSDSYGSFVTPFDKEKGDTRVYINSVGEGAIWVSNTNGSLESGDYITTSNVAGYGQKQESDSLKNYTVAKITMDCDFNPATQSIQIIKKDEEGENVLDKHGQIQWENHATETEKAYKVRFLTADGSQTDEANTVHTAAFVGCTYHCG